MSDTDLAVSMVTVPVLGFGMRPRGPSTGPSLPTLPMRFGVATAASKSVLAPATFSISSASPPSSAPAVRAASACGPVAKTMTRAGLPVPLGRLTVPRTIWSALRGSTPSRIETSTEASNLAGEDFCARRSASSGVYTRPSSIRAAPFLYALLRKPMSSALHRDAHGTSGALDDLRRGLHVVRVQISHLGLRDLADLCLGDLADLVGVRDGGALLEAGGLLDELGWRRGLRDGGEGEVVADRGLDRDDVATLIGGAIVVGLHELHHVHAGSAERGTHGRRRCGLAGLDLELDDARDLLLGSHCSSLLWCGPGGAHHALLPLQGPLPRGGRRPEVRRYLHVAAASTGIGGDPGRIRAARGRAPLRSWRPGRTPARPGSRARRWTPGPGASGPPSGSRRWWPAWSRRGRP